MPHIDGKQKRWLAYSNGRVQHGVMSSPVCVVSQKFCKFCNKIIICFAIFCFTHHFIIWKSDTYGKILFVQLFAANMNTTITIVSTSNTRIRKMPTNNVVCWYLRESVKPPFPLKALLGLCGEVSSSSTCRLIWETHAVRSGARACRKLYSRGHVVDYIENRFFRGCIFRCIVETVRDSFPLRLITLTLCLFSSFSTQSHRAEPVRLQ